MRRRRNLPIVALALAVIAVQLLTAAAGKPQYLTQLTMAGYYSLVIVGLTLLMGYTGQISMGHAGFFAIGGYTSGLLTTYNLHSRSGEMLVSVLQGRPAPGRGQGFVRW
jgi:branched-chain amino acid transport system permease protein